jgi:hypothetical protein
MEVRRGAYPICMRLSRIGVGGLHRAARTKGVDAAAGVVAYGPFAPPGTGRRATALRRGPALAELDQGPRLLLLMPTGRSRGPDPSWLDGASARCVRAFRRPPRNRAI